MLGTSVTKFALELNVNKKGGRLTMHETFLNMVSPIFGKNKGIEYLHAS